MKPSLHKLIFHSFVGILIAAIILLYFLKRPHINVQNITPEYIVSVESLYKDFNENLVESNIKYGNKIIEVTGYIVEVLKDKNEISLVLNDKMEGVNCALDPYMIAQRGNTIDEFSIGDKITVKGKCDGFDMIMGVVLTKCFIYNK